MRGTATREGACEVGVDRGAFTQDDAPHDATLRLGDQTLERVRKCFAQPVERARVAQVKSWKRSEDRGAGGDASDERACAPAESARAISARDRKDGEHSGQQHR